jgi:hypothetical protein
VHHQSYIRTGNESLEDLVSLCRECHKTVHALVDSEGTPLGDAHGELFKLNAQERRRGKRALERMQPLRIVVQGSTFNYRELQKALYGPISDLPHPPK